MVVTEIVYSEIVIVIAVYVCPNIAIVAGAHHPHRITRAHSNYLQLLAAFKS